MPNTTADTAIFTNISAFIGVVCGLWVISSAVSKSLLSGSAQAAQSYVESAKNPMNTIEKRFKTLIEHLKPRRVLILIDDLDRCQSDYAVELLEGIQTLFRDAPVIYVVAADRQWLKSCYEEAYKSFHPSNGTLGKSFGMHFLEKTFQLSASVPAIPSPLRKRYWHHLLGLKPGDLESRWKEARANAEKMTEDAADEEKLMALVQVSEAKNFIEQQAIREAAVVQLASPKVVERTVHSLERYSLLLDPNPRSMKRFVNAYSANMALSTLTYTDIDRDQLALWTILSLRWPILADVLVTNPSLVEQIDTADEVEVAEDIRILLKDEQVRSVINGGPNTIRLNSNAVSKCARLKA